MVLVGGKIFSLVVVTQYGEMITNKNNFFCEFNGFSFVLLFTINGSTVIMKLHKGLLLLVELNSIR